MTIDLREDFRDFRRYICQVIGDHIDCGKPQTRMIHFGFTIDQAGWVMAYLDPRPNASMDGEWTKYIAPTMLMPRPCWYEASELSNLHNLILIGTNGEKLTDWPANASLQKFARFLGEFIRTSVVIFIDEGLFQPLLGDKQMEYCVEEFTGLYCWPVDPEIVKLVESLKLSRHDSGSHTV